MKKKSALIVSISMVLVAVLALTTATFAWFTTSMNPSVNGFDVQVTTSNALLIGVRQKTTDEVPAEAALADTRFQTVIDNATLSGGFTTAIPMVTAEGYADNKTVLTNVTPKTTGTGGSAAVDFGDDKISFQRLKDPDVVDFDYEDAKNDATADGAGITKKDFLTFDLYFRSSLAGNADNSAKKIDVALSLKEAAGTAESQFIAVKPKTDKSAFEPMATADGNAYYLPTALRVGFVAYKVDATGVKATGGTVATQIYEPDKTVPTAFESTNVVDPDKQYKSAADDQFVKGTGEDKSEKLKLFQMANGETWKMSVYVWIEGNDKQAVNEVTGGAFQSVFKFIGAVAA